MSLISVSMLHLLLLLLLQLLISCNGQSQDNYHFIDFASGRIDARVQTPAGTVHVRAFAGVQNEKILQKIDQGSSVYKLSQLKWYTPGYLTVHPFVPVAAGAAGNVSRILKVRDFFKVHYGDSPYLEMRMSLLSDEIIQSLAAEASYSFSQTDSIATRQILLMDLKQIICHSANLNFRFVSVNTHQPYQLISVNSNWTASAFRSFVQNKLIRANSVLLKCNLKFASMSTNVTRQLREGDLRSEQIIRDNIAATAVQMMDRKICNISSDLMRQVDNRWNIMKSELKNLTNEYRRLNTIADNIATAMQMMDRKISNISSDLMRQVDNRWNRMKSELKNLTNEYRKLDTSLGYELTKTENHFSNITVDNRKFIVFQQRRSDSVNFFRTWREYEIGFGDGQNFWLGLANISALTLDNPRLLRVELERFNGAKYVLEYEGFRVFGPGANYEMSYSRMRPRGNNYRDALAEHNNTQFTTWDFDNDRWTYNCADEHKGGWWYRACYNTHPNGIYYNSEKRSEYTAIVWKYIDSSSASDRRSFKSVRMMLEV